MLRWSVQTARDYRECASRHQRLVDAIEQPGGLRPTEIVGNVALQPAPMLGPAWENSSRDLRASPRQC